ncbi:MAG: hypothetical protein J6A21_03000 [Lentisphaeria bacterium]|nr:hypothetical protein [Lentisphaeria bacterium]
MSEEELDLRTVSIPTLAAEKISPSSIAVLKHKEGEFSAFLSGGMVFPAIVKDSFLKGTACVIAFLEEEDVFVLDMFSFDSYDFPLAQFFERTYDRFKLNSFTIRETPEEEAEARRFFESMAFRQYRQLDKIYPAIRKMALRNDTQALSDLLSILNRKKLHIDPNSRFLEGSAASYDPSRPFSEAPHEIQALCIAIADASLRAWKAFENDRIQKLLSRETEGFE